jgi:ankyrin repeat protein
MAAANCITGARVLIDHGANLNVKGTYPESIDTPLHFAAINDYLEFAELLLANGADVNVWDECSRTPLFYAAGNANKPFVELLILYGARTDIRSKGGNTPGGAQKRDIGASVLHYAVLAQMKPGGFHDPSVIDILIKHGADVNATTQLGETPLHLGARGGHVQTVEKLLAYGANPNLRDSRGRTPLEIARIAGRSEAADVIERYPTSKIQIDAELREEKQTIASKHKTVVDEIVKSLAKSFRGMTVEEILKDPIILDNMAILGEEIYKSGITDPVKWHAELFRKMEAIAEGLGLELEPLFPIAWESVSGIENYAGGFNGVYGAKSSDE